MPSFGASMRPGQGVMGKDGLDRGESAQGRRFIVRNTSLPQLRCLIVAGRGGRELEGRMLTRTVLVVVVCGIGATLPGLAHDEARIFQYSPIARLEGEGQYRAEVWRRETASDKEERAWSGSDLHRSSEQAIAAACTTLRETFAASCARSSHNAKAGETVAGQTVAGQTVAGQTVAGQTVAGQTASEPGSVVTQKSSAPTKAPPQNVPIPAAKEVAAAANPGPTNWAKKFWANSSQQKM
jgi:hypothetical protein